MTPEEMAKLRELCRTSTIATTEKLSHVLDALVAAQAENERLRVFESIQLAHDQDHCMDCGALLVPCKCQPNCPGGACPKCCVDGLQRDHDLLLVIQAETIRERNEALEELNDLRRDLAAMTAARDAACELAEQCDDLSDVGQIESQRLRAVGKVSKHRQPKDADWHLEPEEMKP